MVDDALVPYTSVPGEPIEETVHIPYEGPYREESPYGEPYTEESPYEDEPFTEESPPPNSTEEEKRSWWERWKEKREEKRKEKEEEKVEKTFADIKEKELRVALESLKAKERGWKAKGRRTPEQKYESTRKWMTRALTLGGPIKAVRKELYVPTASKGTYIPRSMRSLTSPTGARELYDVSGLKGLNVPVDMRKATTPVGGMRTLTTPPRSARRTSMSMTAGAQVEGAVDTSFRKLRALSDPKTTLQSSPLQAVATRSTPQRGLEMKAKPEGLFSPMSLTAIEEAAYQEIKENHDIDTKAHVVSELEKLGIPREEGEYAVSRLLQRGLVKATTYQGQPILEVKGG